MPNSQLTLSFNIDAWKANSAGLSEIDDWKQWAINGHWPTDEKINAALIPAMMRRRMSTISKLAVNTAIELLNVHQVDYLVFASRHGELHRSFGIISDIIQGEVASPMAFSQSVHNTAAGLATIATKQSIPLTSVSSSDNTFQSAILEAWLFLADNPGKKVLLVDFDEPLPNAYHEFEYQHYPAFSVGLILSSGDEIKVVKSSSVATHNHEPLPQGLTFLKHYLSHCNQWHIHAQRQTWEWHQK